MYTSFEMAQHIAQVYSPLNLDSIRDLSDILVARKFKKGEIIARVPESELLQKFEEIILNS